MNRTDAYVAIAAMAWLVGAYLIRDGLQARATALDHQTTAEYWCSLQYLGGLGGEDGFEDCAAISAAARKRHR